MVRSLIYPSMARSFITDPVKHYTMKIIWWIIRCFFLSNNDKYRHKHNVARIWEVYIQYLLLHMHVIVHDDVIKWKHIPRYWPFMRGIHRSPVNSPHKGQWRGALMFSLISAWLNGLSKQSRVWWFETPSRPLWRHFNVYCTPYLFTVVPSQMC